jgi:chaperonin GroES
MLHPIGDKIVVKRVEEEASTTIVIPDVAKEKPSKAEVVAAGPGRLLKNGTVSPLTVKIGDKVLLSKWGGTEIEYEGNEYLILRESEVLAVLVP